MEPLLYLVHRMPFPASKVGKVRSFHLLEYLASRYSVHLGTFVDDPADLQHVPRLQEFCASSKVVTLRPSMGRIRSLAALWSGEPLTLRYYNDPELAAWVQTTVREQQIRKVVVFSPAMAQYISANRDLRVVVDFVAVNSAKWRQFAQTRPWPLSKFFGREGHRLLAFERTIARTADASVFVTPAEAELFRTLAPECTFRVHHAQNGVDSDYFSPSIELTNPYGPGEEAIVFTGSMDYWPNVDAACWFVEEALPAIVAERPNVRFYIVGTLLSPAMVALARARQVVVTGPVPDVRPYLKHASVVVAPLRAARGIQYNVLEAMAMARPLVASNAAVAGLSAVPAVDLEVADSPAEFACKTLALMGTEHGKRIGMAARSRVLADYHWMTNLAPFEELLAAADELRAGAQ
jgi:sugar transferase (PEP-CTERM/EpsH1 system associated)